MERNDDYPVSQKPAVIRVPFFHSIRLRILLLVLVPLLFSGVAIAVPASVSLNATAGMRETVNRQAALYQKQSLSSVLCSRLSDYLSARNDDSLTDYLLAEKELTAFLQMLQNDYPDQPYTRAWISMNTNLLQTADHALSLADEPDRMLSAYQDAAHVQTLIARFSPYMIKEIEALSASRIEAGLNRVFTTVRSNAVLLTVILLALIVTVMVIVRSFTQPLTALTTAVQTLSLSTDHANVSQTRRKDELGILIRSYHDMVNRIHTQMTALQDKQQIERMLQLEKEKNLRAENDLVRSKLNVYQSQINSHFLFNAFNTVSRLAYIENAAQVQHAVSLIAQFLRNIMTNFDRVITVEEDFSIVQNFVEIQNLRFGDRIKVEYDMDAGTEWSAIPALTMQPLAENAYSHGLSNRKEGYIRCVAEMEEGRLNLYTWDDGVGISPQRQQMIRDTLQTLDDETAAQENIGLRNVYRRLLLLYPGKVNLILDSQEGAYCQIGFSIQIE